MPEYTATAVACPNIAFIKYWGNRDDLLRIPANGSISMNLGGLVTRTLVRFDPGLETDALFLGGKPVKGAPLLRVAALLERVRQLSGLAWFAHVESSNNFPTGAGIASSASAFAALSLAASAAAGLDLNERQLSRLARTGSGSACRSIPGGFVEWIPGEDDASSFAVSLAGPDHWPLVDTIAVVSTHHKRTGSSEGHRLAHTSPLQAARLADTPRRLDLCRRAICGRDFTALTEIVEQDSHLMHAVMMTSQPALVYWEPATLGVLQAVANWREQGLAACTTVDAGPNIHVISTEAAAAEVAWRLKKLPGVQQLLTATVGGPALRCS